ncbi:MAG: carbohydrate binding family 9 domain-containing protein [candidate division Zixibacteria bacterium]|nr:carbohydrate binding family 9 domain-containing protein [candidate division Zixibacteria bacterium]
MNSHFFRMIIAGCIVAVGVLWPVFVPAQTTVLPQTPGRPEGSKDSVGVRLADGSDPGRTTPTAPSPEEISFRTPLPVSTTRFDYSKLAAENYLLYAYKTTDEVKLDGKLSEPDWQMAQPAKDFFQFQPDEGNPATQPTEVRVMYDGENLYVGFMCYDSEPDKLNARDMQRDARIGFSNDMAQVVIAPLAGGREAYNFQTNPNGARTDSFVSQEGANVDQDWNGNWNAVASRHAHGWTAEFMIPFHVLRFSSQPMQTWSINFGRRIQRTREDTYWVPISRKDGQRGLYRFGKGGRLTGLENVQAGGRFQVLPFSVLGSRGLRFNLTRPSASVPIAITDVKYGLQRQFGGDFKWGITSGLTANITVNPDFAQVEADDQVVNLSRFEFRFDEKRPFFLERSDIFSLERRDGRGGMPRPSSTPQLFFSRRIGRQLADGSSTPIDMGLRVTGKIGKTTVGYLSVQSRDAVFLDGSTLKTEPLTNWQALRISRDAGSRSSIGVLATFKRPDASLNNKFAIPVPRFSDSDYNTVVGADLTLASRRTQHEFQAVVAGSWTDTDTTALKSSTNMYFAQRWQNRWMNYEMAYADIGKDFIAQSGFIPETDIRLLNASLSFNPIIRRYGIRSINSTTDLNYTMKRSGPGGLGNPHRWSGNGTFTVELEKGIWISPGYSRRFDTLTGTRYQRIAGVHFAPGEYTYGQYNLFLFTNRANALSGNGFLTFGKLYNANVRTVSVTARYVPTPKISLESTFSDTDLKRASTPADTTRFHFSHRIIQRFRINYSFTPNLSLTSFVQLNADKRRPQDGFHLNTITTNFLVAYRSPHGHSFFIAYNQFNDDALDTQTGFSVFQRTPLRLRDQTIVAKVAYLFNL